MAIEQYEKYQPYLDFIKEYAASSNAATGSKVDANANVECKNVTTLTGELYKKDGIGINRLRMWQKIKEMYGQEYADKYIYQLDHHFIYRHDETNPCLPYTYGAREVVNVRYNGTTYCVPMYRLYEICNEEEVLADEDRIVYIKYPKDMLVEDKNGWTKVERLVRKMRHRDLVRVKTAFNTDIIVTDNHPMIVNDNINDTVEAAESLGEKQFRCESHVNFGNKASIESKEIAGLCGLEVQEYSNFNCIRGNQFSIAYAVPKELILNEDAGYLVGFFIGDGWFESNGYKISFCQKDKEALQKIAEIAYNRFGASSILNYRMKEQKYVLSISNPVLFGLLREHFGIGIYAQNKELPEKIFEYSADFAKGVIAGLIDSDGTIVSDGGYNIRLSSRAAVLQISAVINALGIPTAISGQQTKFGCNQLVQQKYALFGVTFREPCEADKPVFSMALKSKRSKPCKTKQKSRMNEWLNITNVDIVDNEPFLDQNEYIYDITTESHSFVCNGLWVHNCVSITMYPFLFNGLESIGGGSSAPHNLDSFCGEFINLCFAIASQFAGAVATPEFIPYLDYFIRKDYGDDYYLHADKVVDLSNRHRTIDKVITDQFEQVVYSLNQPAAARNFQSIFWNCAYFDKPYFEGMFSDFVFPDGTEMQWESVSWLQKRFMEWLNQERLKKILTFPVETLNLLDDGTDYVDKDWSDNAAEMLSKGHSFFIYRSNSVDSLASCCRLRNEMSDNTFSYTLGAGGVATGSKGVITINMNRLIQTAVDDNHDICDAVREQVKDIHVYLKAWNAILKDEFNAKLLPIYDAGYISLDKQFLTIGINGFVEGCEFLGYTISPDDQNYVDFTNKVLKVIYDENKADRSDGIMFNTEYVPAENLGVKNAKWDKQDGFAVPRDCYNSYFYVVEDPTKPLDKFMLHGSKMTQYLDGGSALHLNLEEHLDKEQYRKLMNVAIKTGCPYWTVNVPNTICNDCGHISKHHLHKCPKCGSENLDYATRVIGYLKRVSSFSEARQKEAAKRYYAD